MATKDVAVDGGGKKPPTGTQTAHKPGWIESIRIFIDEVISEMKKVAWPTQNELKSLTQLVLWSLLVSGIVIGAYDLIFLKLMGLILQLG